MDRDTIGKVYAEALIQIAEASKTTEVIEEELKDVVELICKDEIVWNFLISPRISKAAKLSLVEKAFKSGISEVMASFIRLVVTKDRIFFLRDIQEQYSIISDRIKGRIRTKVFSATKLADSDINEIKSFISQKYKGECIVDTKIDSSLIGGIIIKFKDNLIDGSIKSRLRNIKTNLLASKLQSGAYYEN